MIPPRINPHTQTPTYKRWNNPAFAGGKFYLAVLLPSEMRARRIFKRASEAEKYAVKLHAAACRLYDERQSSLAEPAATAANAFPTHDVQVDAMHEMDAGKALSELP